MYVPINRNLKYIPPKAISSSFHFQTSGNNFLGSNEYLKTTLIFNHSLITHL